LNRRRGHSGGHQRLVLGLTGRDPECFTWPWTDGHVSVARPGNDAEAAAAAADVADEEHWEEDAGWDAGQLAKPKQRRFFKQSPNCRLP